MLGRALHDAGDPDGADRCLPEGHPAESQSRPAPGTWPGPWPRGAGWRRPVPSGKRLEASPRRSRPLGRLRPALRIPRQRGSVPLGPQGPPRTLQRFSTDHWAMAERDGLACLLRPASRGGTPARGRAGGPGRGRGTEIPSLDNAYPQFVKGLAEYRQGRPAQAVPLLRESAALLPNRAGPRLALAMAQFRSGCPKEARRHWRQPSGPTTGWSLRRTTPRRGSATCFAARPRP